MSPPTNAPQSASALDHPSMCLTLFAILVKRLGGKVIITQADFDEIAYDRLTEDYEDDALTLTHVPRRAAS